MTEILGEHVAVVDGPLTTENAGHLRASDLALPMEELRQRYDEEGYLLLKQLLPRGDVLKARQKYFEFLAPTGVLMEGSPAVAGIFNPAKLADDFPGIGAGTPWEEHAVRFVRRAVEAHYQPWYADEFCRVPALYDFVAEFTGWGENTLAFRRSLLRNNVPRSTPIGVHYDQVFLRQGEPTSVTAWVPMGDVKVHGGGLIYLENGDTLGKTIEDDFTRKAKEEDGMSEEQARSSFNNLMERQNGVLSHRPAEFAQEHHRRWLVTAYEAGDVVLHKPHMIHASTVNYDLDDTIRLGTDLRFCDKSKPYDERWMRLFRPGDGV